VWFNRSIDHYVYSDATGATYRLDQNSNGVWTSLDSTYVAFNANNDYLYFPDGSFWLMNVTSVSSEQDAGTIYPSLMEDTNGNQIDAHLQRDRVFLGAHLGRVGCRGRRSRRRVGGRPLGRRALGGLGARAGHSAGRGTREQNTEQGRGVSKMPTRRRVHSGLPNGS
jgi:hypothetical protein